MFLGWFLAIFERNKNKISAPSSSFEGIPDMIAVWNICFKEFRQRIQCLWCWSHRLNFMCFFLFMVFINIQFLRYWNGASSISSDTDQVRINRIYVCISFIRNKSGYCFCIDTSSFSTTVCRIELQSAVAGGISDGVLSRCCSLLLVKSNPRGSHQILVFQMF